MESVWNIWQLFATRSRLKWMHSMSALQWLLKFYEWKIFRVTNAPWSRRWFSSWWPTCCRCWVWVWPTVTWAQLSGVTRSPSRAWATGGGSTTSGSWPRCSSWSWSCSGSAGFRITATSSTLTTTPWVYLREVNIPLTHDLPVVGDGLQIHAARLPGLLLAGHGKLRLQSPNIFQHECEVSTI